MGHERAFREAYRVLRGDGRFVLCHWSGEGSKAPLVVGLLARFRPRELPEGVRRLLEARRSINAEGEPGALGNPEMVIEKLSAIGFREASRLAKSERVVYPDTAAYLARGLAMGDNEREFRLMTPAVREAFLREFEEQATPFVAMRVWSPSWGSTTSSPESRLNGTHSISNGIWWTPRTLPKLRFLGPSTTDDRRHAACQRKTLGRDCHAPTLRIAMAGVFRVRGPRSPCLPRVTCSSYLSRKGQSRGSLSNTSLLKISRKLPVICPVMYLFVTPLTVLRYLR